MVMHTLVVHALALAGWNPKPSTCGALPMSIVIPTIGRRRRAKNLLYLLHTLLLSPLLRHPLSEIVLNHGCRESFDARAEVDKALLDPLGNFYLKDNFYLDDKKLRRQPANASRLNHMLGPRAETFVASRFFAAGAARNELIVTMDDDVMPFASQARVPDLQIIARACCSARRD